jgi:hypothetical protein
MTMRGVLYCATSNSAYLESALISAIALRQLEQNIPISILSDYPSFKDLPLNDYRINPILLPPLPLDNDESLSSRKIKIHLSTLSPYKETLYLDADIIPLKPIKELWNYLSQGDIAMTIDTFPTLALCYHISQEEKNYTLERLEGSTTQFNSGVILWRKTIQTQLLFEQWYKEWLIFKKHDQLALIRAIHDTQSSITILPSIYNISPVDAASMITQKPVAELFHGQAITQDHQIESIPMLKQKNDVCLLHCWDQLVPSGKFCQIAQEFYPDIVEKVVKMGIFTGE